MASLRDRPRPSSPLAGPLEDDDLLAEILLRLPPLPSSLPRASAVSRRWRSLVSEPHFSRRFRAHHRRNPPVPGCFVYRFGNIFFEPALEAPNRVPQGRFSFPIDAGNYFMLLGCRHGLVLSFHDTRKQLLVWDPVIGEQHRLDIPLGFDPNLGSISAAVLHIAGDVQHFKVVLVGTRDMQHTRAVAAVYSSATGAWGNLITAMLPSKVPVSYLPTLYFSTKPAVMAGDFLYWKLVGNFVGILEFDLEKQCLAVIQVQRKGTSLTVTADHCTWQILTEGGELCFLFQSGFGYAELWKRKKGCDGVASWVLERTIELDKLLPLNSEKAREGPLILGFAEENNVVLLRTSNSIFTVQLESLEIKKVFESNYWYRELMQKWIVSCRFCYYVCSTWAYEDIVH